MKIKITTTNDVIGNLINSGAEIKSYYTDESETKLSKELDKKLMGVDVHKNFAGGSYSYKCAPSYKEYGEVEFNMNLDDNAFIMALKVGTKIAKVLSPLYDMGKSMIKLTRNICNEIKDLGKSYSAEYGKRFGKKATYCVFSMYEECIEADDVIIVRNDGYENDDSIQVVYARHFWSVNNLDILTKIVKAKHLDKDMFTIPIEREAFDTAENMARAIEKDPDGILEARHHHNVR